jgi:GntR family transcriptional regulator
MGEIDGRTDSLVPLYRQVSNKLLAEIASGAIAAGQALPPEHTLCRNFQVSRITVRKALDELVARRIVVRRHGVGTFVSDDEPHPWSVTLTGVLEDILTPQNLEITREAVVCPPADVLAFAKLPENTRLKLFEGINHVGSGTPLVHLAYYFPDAIARSLSAEALSGPLQTIKVVEQNAACKVDYADQIVVPMIATGTIAKSLQIPSGTAVLRVIRVYFDTQARLIEIIDGAYHPTNYRYTARLHPRAHRTVIG